MADDNQFNKDYYYQKALPANFNPKPHLVIITKTETGLSSFFLLLF